MFRNLSPERRVRADHARTLPPLMVQDNRQDRMYRQGYVSAQEQDRCDIRTTSDTANRFLLSLSSLEALFTVQLFSQILGDALLESLSNTSRRSRSRCIRTD